jgi:hypothetical protein
MLGVMNDPAASEDRRDRMAVTAARYCHVKAGRKGKKDERAEAARDAAANAWDGDLAVDGHRQQ